MYWGKRVGASRIDQRDVGANCQFLCDRSDRVRMSGKSPRIAPTERGLWLSGGFETAAESL